MDRPRPYCADCSATIGKDNGPLDGWQLENGRTVCMRCAVNDFQERVRFYVGMKAAKIEAEEVLNGTT